MKYECREFQWVESDSGHEPSTEFNKFSNENDGKFEVIHMMVVSSRTMYEQACETLYVMIKWL